MRLEVPRPDQLVAFESLEHTFAGAGAGFSLGEAGDKLIAALGAAKVSSNDSLSVASRHSGLIRTPRTRTDAQFSLQLAVL
eukprot:12601244-Alexandrium_andersonii.AAC.1